MGFLVVTAVLVVSFGRLGDMFGRVRMFNLGFAVFAVFSVLLSVTWMHGTAAAWWLIVMRVLQGVGGAMLMANSSAILTDAFPTNQRGLALGLNQVAAIGGLVHRAGARRRARADRLAARLPRLGAVRRARHHLVVPEAARAGRAQARARLDWWGNVTFAAGLIAVLVGITYGIQPYGGHTMGWTSPLVLEPDLRRPRGARRVLRDRDARRRADVPARAVPDPPVHRGEPGQPAVRRWAAAA